MMVGEGSSTSKLVKIISEKLLFESVVELLVKIISENLQLAWVGLFESSNW